MPFEDSQMGRYALIMSALRSVPYLQGRIKVQKILYLSNLCGWNCIKDYRYYNFGPYSDAVTTDLETFKTNGWVMEQPYGAGHSYSLTDRGQRIADSLAAKMDNPKLIRMTRELVESLNNYSSDDLEIMATLVFINRSERSLSKPDLISRVVELKPRFTEKQVAEDFRVFRLLKDFGYLVKDMS